MADRVQVNQDLGLNSPLRPVAAPTDAYYKVTPDTVQLGGGGDFADLAKSVGLATPVLQKALSEEEKFQHEQEVKRGLTARLTNQKNFKDAQAAGLIRPAENPWFIKGYMQQDGRLSGMNYDIAMRTAWMSDPSRNSDNPQDFQKFQNDFRTQWIKENDGKTPDWMDGFAPKMAQADNNMAAQHVAHRQQVIEETQKQNTGIEISKSLTEMTEVLNSPETRMLPGADAAIRQSYTDRFTALGKDLVAKGMSGKDFNAIVAEQSMAFAKKNSDESLLDIAKNVETGSGKLGQIAHINAQFVEADHQIRAQRYQELVQAEYIAATPERAAQRVHALKAIEHTEKQWKVQQASEDRAEAHRGFASAAYMGFQAGKKEDPEMMLKWSAADPEGFATFQNWKHTQLVNKAQIIGDQVQAAQMMMQIDRDASTVSVQSIYSQVRPGGINMDQANNLRARLDHNNLAENSAANKDPFFRDAFEGLTGAVIGNPYNAAGETRMAAHAAGSELRDFYNENIKDQKLSDSDRKKLLREKSLELLTHANKTAAERAATTKAEQDLVKAVAKQDADIKQRAADAEQARVMNNIPPAAITGLRAHPELVKDFEKKYGLRPGLGANFLTNLPTQNYQAPASRSFD